MGELSNLPIPKLPDHPLTYLLSTTMRRPRTAMMVTPMGQSPQYLQQQTEFQGVVLFQPRPKILEIFKESFNNYRHENTGYGRDHGAQSQRDSQPTNDPSTGHGNHGHDGRQPACRLRRLPV